MGRLGRKAARVPPGDWEGIMEEKVAQGVASQIHEAITAQAQTMHMQAQVMSAAAADMSAASTKAALNMTDTLINLGSEITELFKACPGCCTPVPAVNEFCPNCQTALPGQTIAQQHAIACKACGAKNYRGTRLCIHCGKDIKNQSNSV